MLSFQLKADIKRGELGVLEKIHQRKLNTPEYLNGTVLSRPTTCELRWIAQSDMLQSDISTA